jgi:hypothetical protein
MQAKSSAPSAPAVHRNLSRTLSRTESTSKTMPDPKQQGLNRVVMLDLLLE